MREVRVGYRRGAALADARLDAELKHLVRRDLVQLAQLDVEGLDVPLVASQKLLRTTLVVVQGVHGHAVHEDAVRLVGRERCCQFRQGERRPGLGRVPLRRQDAAGRVEEDDLRDGRRPRSTAGMHPEHLGEGSREGRCPDPPHDAASIDLTHWFNTSTDRRVVNESWSATPTKSSGMSRSRVT